MQKLFACTEGWHPTSVDELRSVFTESSGIFDTLTDIYIVPLDIKDSRLAIRITPFITNIQDGGFDFDFGIQFR